VLVATHRARKLHSGDTPTVEKDNDKNTVIALREIADSSISVEDMKENLIQEYQTITISDEEDENLEMELLDKKLDEDNLQDSEAPNNNNSEIEEEMKELISSEESEIEEQYEITDNTDNDDLQVNTDSSDQIHEK
jgi:DNA-directed RNA polymerase subunit omega